MTPSWPIYPYLGPKFSLQNLGSQLTITLVIGINDDYILVFVKIFAPPVVNWENNSNKTLRPFFEINCYDFPLNLIFNKSISHVYPDELFAIMPLTLWRNRTALIHFEDLWESGFIRFFAAQLILPIKFLSSEWPGWQIGSILHRCVPHLFSKVKHVCGPVSHL